MPAPHRPLPPPAPPAPLAALAALAPLVFAVLLLPVACSGAHVEDVPDHHDDGTEPVGAVSSRLSPSDSVATAAAESCTTTAVKGLALQLVDEIQCLQPGTFVRIDNAAGLALGPAVLPYLQPGAAAALVAAQKARGGPMSINSALRTLPQQYLLYRWYKSGRCDIGLAATPGTSNHEGALAVDIEDNAGWRSAMQSGGFHWLGATDPVHYDFVSGATVDLRGLSAKAFQRLWNRNHPTDLVAEDGDYGPATESRLASAPSGGFAKGADCSKMPGDAGEGPPVNVPSVPDATGPGDAAPPAPATGSGPRAPNDGAEASGCSVGPVDGHGSAVLFGAGVLGLVLATRRRRR